MAGLITPRATCVAQRISRRTWALMRITRSAVAPVLFSVQPEVGTEPVEFLVLNEDGIGHQSMNVQAG